MSDNTRITIAQTARVYLAVLGTIAPVDDTVALDPAWREVGLFTPDSLRFADNPDFDTVTSHQSSYPTRRFQKGETASMQVDLQEFSARNMVSVMGGGTVSQIAAPAPPAAGHYKYSPPAIGGRSDVSAILEIVDGVKRYRLIIPRATNTETVQVDWKRTNETILPLRLMVDGSDVGDPWYLLSNDPAWSPTAV